MSDDKPSRDIHSPADALSSPQFAEMLDKVLANPEIISAVASALSSGSKEEKVAEVKATVAPKNETPPAPEAALAEKLPELMSVLKPMLSGSGKSSPVSDRRACLLNAMKPYLNDKRCEAIDYMVKFSQLAELIKAMN